MEYKTHGVCAREIKFGLDGNTDQIRRIYGGYFRNTQGVARLVEGMKVDDAIARMEGIRCGAKSTSCPDQLAQALKKKLPANNMRTKAKATSFHLLWISSLLPFPVVIHVTKGPSQSPHPTM